MIGIAGCATGPSYSQYTANLAPPKDGYGRIWFYRSTIAAAGIQPVIKLDDRIVGHAVPQGYFHVDVPAGAHQVGATMVFTHSIVINVTTNCDSYVRFTPLFGLIPHHFMPEEVDASLAPNTMRSMHLAVR